MSTSVSQHNLKDISRLQTQMEHVNEKLDSLEKEQTKTQQEQKEGFDKILQKIENLGNIYVRKEIYDKDMKELKKEDQKRIDNKTWFWKTVLVVIIGIVVSSLTNILISGVINEIRGGQGSQAVQSCPSE